MFPDLPYYRVNREERHFGFLFMLALALNGEVRQELISYINSKTDSNIEPSQIDVYAEVSLFRDYWRALGDPAKYSSPHSTTHSLRHQILSQMLEVMKIDPAIIESDPLFWSGQPRESKLFYPGKWYEEKIDNTASKHGIEGIKLWRLRWACNAKPDVMIEDPKNIVLVEIKVESGFGKSVNGYDQEKTQKDILLIAKKLLPSMANKTLKFTSLTLDGNELVWSEIIRILKGSTTPEIFEMVNRHLLAMPK